MATKKRKSRILGEMHETALGLHDAGVISKRRMGEFEALCHLDVHEMPPRKIKSLREMKKYKRELKQNLLVEFVLTRFLLV